MIGERSEANDVGRGIGFALMVQECWKKEIEEAIDRIKNSVKRSKLDKRFRRQWYKTQARDKK